MSQKRPDLFTHVLNQLRYGAAQEDLSEQLAHCVDRARETGKAAEITLKIKIKPQGQSGQYILLDEIKVKAPEPVKEQTIMFGTPEGNLTREDPRQQKLPLRDVSAAAGGGDLKSAEKPASELRDPSTAASA
jgi:hypothetical protein